MAEPAAKRMTLDEFLSWDDGTDTRYELWGGVVTAMAPPMPLHGRLVSRLITALSNALRGRAPCDVYSEAGVIRPDRNDTFTSPTSPSAAKPSRPMIGSFVGRC